MEEPENNLINNNQKETYQISFSEYFYNNIDLLPILKEYIKEKYPNKTIWLYTGYKWEEIWHYPMMKNIDVLVDGEYVEEQRDTKLLWKGSSNQRVIDVQATLEKSDKLIPVLHCGDYS